MGLKSLLLSISMVASLNAVAQKTETDSPVRVNTTDPRFAGPEMRKKAHVTLDAMTPAWGISQADRNRIFKEARLLPKIQETKMDELDQDLLYLSLKNRELSEVANSFPQFTEESLKAAKDLLRACAEKGLDKK